MPTTFETRRTVHGLPTPTGRFEVGRAQRALVDPTRKEIYSTEAGARRELLTWVWYPGELVEPRRAAEYLPDGWGPVLGPLGLDVEGIRSHAVTGARVSGAEPSYPVLVMSPSGFPPLLMAATAEELASHGYVVVGVQHPYETAVTVFPDGRTVPMNPAALAGALGPQGGAYEVAFARRREVCRYKAADLASVADELERMNEEADGLFAGRLDLNRLAAFGHSFGGNAALEWCRQDPRCRAAVNLDGALWTEVGTSGLDRPALQILAQHDEFSLPPDRAVRAGLAPDQAWFEAERSITYSGWRTVAANARPGYVAQLEGASHVSFMDVPFLPTRDGAAVLPMVAATTIDARRAWRVVNDLMLAFFGLHLDGLPAPLLEGPGPEYPEVTFGAPRHPLTRRSTEGASA